MTQVPDDPDEPRETNLSRRSRSPAVSPWLLICLIVLIGLVVYAASALL